NVPAVVALNMYDEFRNQKDYLKYDNLGKMLGIPFVPTIAKKGKGINALFKKIIQVIEQKEESVRQVDIPYNAEIERAISSLQDKLQLIPTSDSNINRFSRYFAVRLLEGDLKLLDNFDEDKIKMDLKEEAKARITHIDSLFTESTSDLITNDKYGFIEGALKETLVPGGEKKHDISRRIDNVLTHSIFSLPLFFGIILLVFYFTFSIGGYSVAWLESLFDLANVGLTRLLPEGILRDLVTQGVIPGVGAIAVFLPNIIILFLFISFMEDTGYMARTAFIIDRIMHRAGLHGKSFIPLLIGFGCNVPAIMATRTIEDRRNRLLTMSIIPFVSCSARLPVYVLFISAFFASWKPLVLFSLYMTGIILAWLTAILFGKLLFKKAETPFVMELPPYRLPTPKAIIQHMWFKTWYFIKKMGGVILLASVIIWALGYFPKGMESTDIIAQHETGIKNDKVSDPEVVRIENSYIGKIGKWIHPVFQPLGFDWKMSVALQTGLAAKEVVVSTLGVLYSLGDAVTEEESSLIAVISK
ncbi:MAG: ferrous iron transport protein B, partial [Bacteroidales bacterium]|nr:ferrous iron transport protein B [Bacteroidales bacterium]